MGENGEKGQGGGEAPRFVGGGAEGEFEGAAGGKGAVGEAEGVERLAVESGGLDIDDFRGLGAGGDGEGIAVVVTRIEVDAMVAWADDFGVVGEGGGRGGGEGALQDGAAGLVHGKRGAGNGVGGEGKMGEGWIVGKGDGGSGRSQKWGGSEERFTLTRRQAAEAW